MYKHKMHYDPICIFKKFKEIDTFPEGVSVVMRRRDGFFMMRFATTKKDYQPFINIFDYVDVEKVCAISENFFRHYLSRFEFLKSIKIDFFAECLRDKEEIEKLDCLEVRNFCEKNIPG